MQTFLPYPDFVASAKCLDYRRLGKQRQEAKKMCYVLHRIKDRELDDTIGPLPWENHPAVQMWMGYEVALLHYGRECCVEWIRRGYKDNTLPLFDEAISWLGGDIKMPWWLGNDKFHSSHRAVLLFKDTAYYSQFGWSETPAYNYWWPTKEAKPCEAT